MGNWTEQGQDRNNQGLRIALLRFVGLLGKFAAGSTVHLLALVVTTQLITSTSHWKPEWNEVAGFVLVFTFPIHLLPFCVYGWLAARMRWTRFWMIAAGLGVLHGVVFESMVYSWNRPSG